MLLSLCVETTEACEPQSLCSATREVTAMRSPSTARKPREKPQLAVTRESLRAANKNTRATKKSQCSRKEKKDKKYKSMMNQTLNKINLVIDYHFGSHDKIQTWCICTTTSLSIRLLK